MCLTGTECGQKLGQHWHRSLQTQSSGKDRSSIFSTNRIRSALSWPARCKMAPHAVPHNPLAFDKMSGSGNDFVFPEGSFGWTPARVRAWCDRRNGVGADGLVLLTPGAAFGDVRMEFYNCDGSPAPMCGNAALCATRLAVARQFAPAGRVRLLTGGATVVGRCIDEPGVAEIDLEPFAAPTQLPSLLLERGERTAALVRVGVPHLVIVVDDTDAVDVLTRGRELRYHPLVGPDGANVQFLAPPTGGEWRLRTYERGVEAETLACGTGCAAAAGVLSSGGPFCTPFRTASAKRIEVRGDRAGDQIRGVTIRGEGRLVYRGLWYGAETPGEP